MTEAALTRNAPYRDPSLPVADRVADLVSRMTLAEKVGQMLQLDARDGVDDLVENYLAGSILHASPENLVRAAKLAADSRLGIPLIVGEDCIHGHSFFKGATIYPTQLGMAASWDPSLLERVARATAVEVSTTGIHWTFSPVLCIARDLRWGRVNETFGEDPHLIGELASAMVKGYQGDGLDDPTAILATAKHFAGYSETQGGRDATEADISRRKMTSWYLPPFERVAREGCGTFMLGYQATDGVPITINTWLLRETMRDQWGYQGMLVTDWDNVGNLVREQRLFPDYAQAGAAAVKAGNDMIMTTPAFFEGAQEAVRTGLLEERLIDEALSRILTLKFRLGLFENPRIADADAQAVVVGSAPHMELNLEVARRSLVLLQNDGTLPLDASAPKKRIAVVGPNADDTDVTLGDWAGRSGQTPWMPEGHPRDMISTVLDGVRAVAPADWEVTYSRGAEIVSLIPDPDGPTYADGQPRHPIAAPVDPDPAMIAEAVEAARNADHVVAVVGDNIYLCGEGRSTATLDLLGDQIALLDALAETGTPMTVVLLASKPLVLPRSAHAASSIVWVANPGMQGGRAIAELLFGQIEPSGRLPISFARHVGQQPTFYNQIDGQHGTRYADLTQSPAWAFGEGLSYTTVEYSDLAIEAGELGMADAVRGSVVVTNTGARPALETVQVYIRDRYTSATWADRELKTHAQVWLEPGETERVAFEVPVAACTFVNAAGERVVEPGEFHVLVGPCSRLDQLLVAPFTVA
jgi:beta-glucosidase